MSSPLHLDPQHPTVPVRAAPAELSPGATLHGGRYVVRSVLGRGGVGITYRADDDRLQRAVAIKELFPGAAVRVQGLVLPPAHEAAAFAEAKARFLREASVLARFTDPGIVRVYEVFDEAGTAYLVMELLDGCSLADLLARRGALLSETEALDVALRCARALAVVHGAGVLHRDVNPANIVVTESGRVVLIDFGLAREFVGDEAAAMTRMVTPGYSPPEQYTGAGSFGASTDVYGLAATLYWALTGSAPTAALDRQGGAALTPVKQRMPAVSRLVSDAIADGLELNPDHRPQSIDAFLARLGVATAAVPPRSILLDVPGEPVTQAAPSPAGQDVTRDGSTALLDHGGRQPAPPLLSPPFAGPTFAGPTSLPRPPVAPQGRWKVAAPALLATAAVGAAAPVLGLAVLAVLVLPAVATAGDAVVYVRLRRHEGERLRWKHRVTLPAYVPARMVRNIGAVLRSGVPALLLVGSTVAVALLVQATGATRVAEEWVLRPGAAAAALLLAVPVFRDRLRFRAAVIGDRVLDYALDDGELTSNGAALWVVAILLALVGFGLRPDLYPF
jgi:serine/threonine-protein kinase